VATTKRHEIGCSALAVLEEGACLLFVFTSDGLVMRKV
jgi:hypothetical protein